MEYTILILALPVLSFLVLALAGMKMPHKVAGTIGTLSLAAVTVLVELPVAAVHRVAAHRHGHHARPYLGDDACGYLHGVAHGAYLFVRIYEGRTRIPALLCFPLAVHFLNARTGGGYEYLPDVRVLGACGSFVLSVDRFLLHQA